MHVVASHKLISKIGRWEGLGVKTAYRVQSTSRGNASLYYTPSDVDLSIETMEPCRFGGFAPTNGYIDRDQEVGFRLFVGHSVVRTQQSTGAWQAVPYRPPLPANPWHVVPVVLRSSRCLEI